MGGEPKIGINEYMKIRRVELKRKMICPICGSRKAKSGYVNCDPCLEYRKRKHSETPVKDGVKFTLSDQGIGTSRQ